MDYRLEVYLAGDDQTIKYNVMRTMRTSQGLLRPPLEEEVVEQRTYNPPMYVIQLIPQHTILNKLKQGVISNPTGTPKFVEFEQIRVPKQACILRDGTGNMNFIKWEEDEDPEVEGRNPVIDVDKLMQLANVAIDKFKRNNDVNVIIPGMGWQEIWTSPDELKKALR